MKVLRKSNEASDEVTYQNKYGQLRLIPVEAYTNIASISSELKSAQQNLIAIDDAEKVALITESRGIQLCVNMNDLRNFYLVHYKSVNEAAVCSVRELKFLASEPAREIIQREAKSSSDFSFRF